MLSIADWADMSVRIQGAGRTLRVCNGWIGLVVGVHDVRECGQPAVGERGGSGQGVVAASYLFRGGAAKVLTPRRHGRSVEHSACCGGIHRCVNV